MNEIFTLSIAALTRSGVLRPGATGIVRWARQDGGATELRCFVSGGEDRLVVELRYSGRIGPVRVEVPVERSQSGSEEAKWWFHCPNVTEGGPCGRTVGKLFLTAGDDVLACRHCKGIRYERIPIEDLEDDDPGPGGRVV